MSAMRSLALLAAFACFAAPAVAQTEERLTLHTGDAVQVQMVRDTSWKEAGLVDIGGCTLVRLESERDAEGFIARGFAGVAALRVADASHRWHQLGATQLAELRACGPGGSPPAPIAPDCGPASDLARGYVVGMVAGVQRRGPTGQPTDELIGVGEQEVSPVTSGSLCQEILMASSHIVADADTIPLIGIMRVGGAGYVVARLGSSTDAAGRKWVTTIYLDADLVVRVRQDQRL